jgi:hypothetical protein
MGLELSDEELLDDVLSAEEEEELAPGEWERRSDRTLWAVDVSPDSRALSRESSAFSSGLPELLLDELLEEESRLLS